NDARTLGKARRDLRKARLDVLDYGEGILAVALDGDTGRHLTLAVEFGDTPPLVGNQLYAGHVPHEDGSTSLRLEHDLLDILNAAQVAASTYHELSLGKFDDTAPHVHVGHADGGPDFVERNVEGSEPLRIDHHAVLLDEASKARHLGHTRGLGNGKAHLPVLRGAQLRQRPLFGHQDVLVDPAHTGRIGSERGGNPGWKL